METYAIALIVIAAVTVLVIALAVIFAVRRKKEAKKEASAPKKKVAAKPQPKPAPKPQPKPEAKPAAPPAEKATPTAKPQSAPTVEKKEPSNSVKTAPAAKNVEMREPKIDTAQKSAEGQFVYLRYNKSFKAKLIQGKDEVREYYNEIKNCIAGYKKVSTRISWKQESVHRGRMKIGCLVLRGKSLYIYLPLNPDDYADTKYKVELADSKRFEELPCLYRIKNSRRVKYAKELIATVMEKFGIEHEEKPQKNYLAEYPYEDTLPLIERGLIKVTRSNRKVDVDEKMSEMIAENMVKAEPREEVRAQEVNELMTDEEAAARVETGTKRADTTKKGIINVDMLSRHFEEGERVTLDEIKKRVHGFDKKVTFVKVLARGVLNKKLIVEADEFSVEAQKMILLTGGQVIKNLSGNEK